MPLPEIVDRVKALWKGFDDRSKPITLDLKGFGDWDTSWYERNGFRNIAEAIGAHAPAWSGETVSRETALNHSVVFTCTRILAESMGFLPLDMMQRKSGEMREAFDKPMYSGLQDAPNDEITAQGFRETLGSHAVLGGNAYAQILRRTTTGVAYELWPLMPSQVTPDREKSTGQKRLVYVVKEGNSADKTYTVERGKPHDILHVRSIGWNGVIGYSVLKLARHSIGTALATERNVAAFFKRGGRLPYNLKLKQEFGTPEDFKKFREDWEAVYADPHRAPILEPFIEEYQQTGVSAVDAQLLETRQFSVPEICRWFRISPHLAGDLSRATFSNIEQLAIEFVNFTLIPWLRRWEKELWRCVLTPEEKAQGYYWKHNVNALLRGDFEARMRGYATALQNGYMSQNEVRALEDWNGFEGGDEYHIQLNMQQLPTGPAQQSQGSLVRLGQKKQRTIPS